MPYLLTPSLHASWYWYHKMETKTKKDFLDTLNKVPFEKDEKILLGDKFERDVVYQCSQPLIDNLARNEPHIVYGEPEWDDCVRRAAAYCRGGIWQERVNHWTTINGFEVLLYGKMDNVNRNRIIDLKYTESYEIGKYNESIQHKLYMVCSKLPKFSYVATDGKNLFVEDYNAHPTDEAVVRSELGAMLDNIMADKDFKEAFHNNWQTKYDNRKAG